ncbi:MAG: LPS export ABC transporter periplasmic protein LptC [Gemmobacter sp.]|jgi:lipopolysaccharide export system protein LptC|nr:LPS export ABC transporter periplasmic protein LptC [Gemmobacter sp.]
MARADNVHSRLVGALKVALPLAALAVLSTLFLLSRSRDPDAALPYAQVDIASMLRDPRLTAPTYSGVTREGDEVIFSARTAHPAGTEGTGARAVAPVLRLIGPDGAETRAVADEARVDPGAQTLVLEGAVRLDTPTGYWLESDALRALLDRSQLESPGPVSALGPQGRIAAGGFTLTRTETPGQEVLVFKGGVKLLYQP